MEQLRKNPFADVRLPDTTSDVAVERQSPLAASIKRAKKRALIVEASASSLRLCRDVLEGSGFTTETVASGIAALTSAREQRPDLIVMDAQLPDVPGREFIGWLRSVPALQSIPVIAFAGATGDGAGVPHTGLNTLLRRPVSALMIYHAIHAALNSH